ncbi:MAG: hypothetical protein BWY86_00897 [Candidatus Aminicenantes bacterium ADurb.Bin508]|nr:MAG: hypothetical protein BWY86_00897 [Candidatus Aminicenantes bacterium ADurb.Bin508]
MESSTKIPITRDMARRDIRFKEKSKRYMAVKVEIREQGMATMTIRELRMLWRKISMTKATRTMANRRSFLTALAASRVKVELSWETVNFRPILA